MALLEATANLRDARYIFEGLAPQFTPEKVQEQDIVVAELLKNLIFDLVRDRRSSPKEAMELARGWVATLQARKLSAQQREEEERRLMVKAEKAVEAVAVKRGLTAEAKDAILDALRGSIK